MRKIAIITFLFVWILGLDSALAQVSDSKSLNVTVYNNDLGVIRDVREIEFKNRTETIRITDVAEKIDPTSVHIKLNGTVLEQNYQYDLANMWKIMSKYIDKEITLIGDNVITGTLLSVSPANIVLRNKDGGLLMLPKYEQYRVSVSALPEGLITKPTLVWMIEPDGAGKQDVELSYQTSGMNWHAEYVAVLNEDDTKMDLNAWVSVENQSGTTYKDAKLKLIAGEVNRIQTTLRGYSDYIDKNGGAMPLRKAEQFQEKEFFEYHIYDMQRPSTIANNETKQISLFEASNINITKKFLYKSFGYNIEKGKVEVVVEFLNSEKNNMGKPMPRGKVRLNKSEGKSLEFIGEDMVDHTPKDERVKLKVGDAFDIVAEEKMTESETLSDKVHDYGYEVKIKNRKKDNIEVEVERNLGLNWKILESSLKYEKKDAQTIVFKVPVKHDEEVTLSYKVRFTY
jgi:hypothetical protein